jgi:hypothetical protein
MITLSIERDNLYETTLTKTALPDYIKYQGWPEFFSHGPFKKICNVLGAASSFQEVEGFKNFEHFSADL